MARRHLLDPREGTLAVWLLAPTAVLLALVVVYPVGRLAWTSLYDLVLSAGGVPRYVGLENYGLAFEDPGFRDAAWVTALIAVVTVPGALVLGLGLALLANLPFRRRWPVRLALLVPWALPLAFTGLIFGWFFHSQYGVVNDVLGAFGVAPRIWLNSAEWSLVAVCVAIIWKSSSFVALILLAGLQTIPDELYEAANIDGASRWRSFVQVTLPLLRPAIAVAAIFRTITALQTFDIPFTMTRGGPGRSTTTLAMLIHQTTVDFLDLGTGSTLAMLLALASLVLSLIYIRALRT